VAAGKTCAEPVPWLATIAVTTSLGTPIYPEATGERCSSKGGRPLLPGRMDQEI
jgi:hypothetical protein